MSEMDERKKRRELGLLEQTLGCARGKGGEARRNVDRLAGSIVLREEPDFAMLSNDSKRVIGIEHFRIDHLVRKDKKVQSRAAQFANEIERKREATLSIVDEAERESIQIDYFREILEQAIYLEDSASPDDLLRSLNARLYGETGHCTKLDTYSHNLEHSYLCSSIELGFFIELHSDFSNCFLHDKNRFKQLVSGEYPLSPEFFCLLNQVSKIIDWIIIGFYNNFSDSIVDAVVARCKNGKFKLSMGRQGFRPIKYLGFETVPLREKKPCPRGAISAETAGGSIALCLEKQFDAADLVKRYEKSYLSAIQGLELSQRKEPFVASTGTKIMYESLQPFAQRKCLSSNRVLPYQPWRTL